MAKVKSRKQGTSIVVTVPAEYRVEPNQEFTTQMLHDGSIMYVPVKHHFPQPWNATPEEIKAFNNQIGIVDDEGAYGRESIDY